MFRILNLDSVLPTLEEDFRRKVADHFDFIVTTRFLEGTTVAPLVRAHIVTT